MRSNIESKENNYQQKWERDFGYIYDCVTVALVKYSTANYKC